jgi:hypothetical protein
MNSILFSLKGIRAIALTAPLFIFALLGITACTPMTCLTGSWGGGDTLCKSMSDSDRRSEDQQILRALPEVQKRADAGDVKAQFAMGEFHVNVYSGTTYTRVYPNADRTIGLGYYYKAGLQGDLKAQRIFAAETLYDCRAKASKLRKAGGGAPLASNLPQCTAWWGDMEALAKNQCAC